MARVVSVVSPVLCLTIVPIAGLLLYAAVRSRLRLALGTVGALAVGYAVLVVAYVFPAIDQAVFSAEDDRGNQGLGWRNHPALFMYIPGWPKNEDAVYYLKRDTVLSDLPNQEAVTEAAAQAWGHQGGDGRAASGSSREAIGSGGRNDSGVSTAGPKASCSYCLCAVTCEQNP